MSRREEPSGPLFPRLSGGRGGPGAEAVARHQRGRLMGAMLEAVGRHGYAKTTLSELVALAGVSKSTFYARFSSKDECLAASFEAVVEVAAERIGAAFGSDGDPPARLGAALDALLEIISERPDAARLAFVDSLGLDGRAYAARRDRAVARFERLLRPAFEQGPFDSQLAACAVVGGLRRILFEYLRDGRGEELRARRDELLQWVLSYRQGAIGDPPEVVSPTPGPAPSREERRDGHDEQEIGWDVLPDSPSARAALGRRERIARATVLLAARHGYASLSIPAIATAAGVSNQTFYAHFDDTRGAFLAGYGALIERAIGATQAAFDAAETWPEGIAAAAHALLEEIAADPLLAALAFLDVPALTSAGIDRTSLVGQSLTPLLRTRVVDGSFPTELTLTAITGGVWVIVYREVTAGRGAALPSLSPGVTKVALLPFSLSCPSSRRAEPCRSRCRRQA